MKKKMIAMLLCLTVVLTGCGSKSFDEKKSGDDLGTSTNGTIADDETRESAIVDFAVVEPEDVPEAASVETYIQDERIDGLEIKEAYVPVLNKTHEILLLEDVSDAEGPIGLIESAAASTPEEALNNIGFAFKDLNKDGVEELLIIEQYVKNVDEEKNDQDNETSLEEDKSQQMILAAYTIQDNEAVLILEGWNRSRYYLLKNNVIYHEGSGGAAYTMFGTSHLSEDGITFVVDDYYFSDYADEAESDWGWFHNKEGMSDVSTSKRVFKDDEDAAWKLQDEYLADVVMLDSYMFIGYQER